MIKKISCAILLLFASVSWNSGIPSLSYEEPLYDPTDPYLHTFHDTRTEWLYFTGIVETDEGKRYGYQVTLFQVNYGGAYIDRFAYIGHVALSDPEAKIHYKQKHTLLPHPQDPTQIGSAIVKLNGFSYEMLAEGFHIEVVTETLSLSFHLHITTPPLPHGEEGLVTMGDGHKSGYYSYTDLSTSGTLACQGHEYNIVSGRTWMDHQWGNFSPLALHWEWFSLRLEDKSALMVYFLHKPNQEEADSIWTYRTTQGEVYCGRKCALKSHRIWREKEGPTTYLLDWTLTIPELDATFEIRPLFDDQHFHNTLLPSYWEGWCAFSGQIDATEVKGDAYVELINPYKTGD